MTVCLKCTGVALMVRRDAVSWDLAIVTYIPRMIWRRGWQERQVAVVELLLCLLVERERGVLTVRLERTVGIR